MARSHSRLYESVFMLDGASLHRTSRMHRIFMSYIDGNKVHKKFNYQQFEHFPQNHFVTAVASAIFCALFGKRAPIFHILFNRLLFVVTEKHFSLKIHFILLQNLSQQMRSCDKKVKLTFSYLIQLQKKNI